MNINKQIKTWANTINYDIITESTNDIVNVKDERDIQNGIRLQDIYKLFKDDDIIGINVNGTKYYAGDLSPEAIPSFTNTLRVIYGEKDKEQAVETIGGMKHDIGRTANPYLLFDIEEDGLQRKYLVTRDNLIKGDDVEEQTNESDVPRNMKSMNDIDYSHASKDKIESLKNAINGDTSSTANFIQVFLAEIYGLLDPSKRSEVSRLIRSLRNGDNDDIVNAVNNSWNFVARNG